MKINQPSNDANVTLPVSPANGGTGTATVFTQGSVVFAGAAGVYSQDNANFGWKDANTYLNIGPALNLTNFPNTWASFIGTSGSNNYAQVIAQDLNANGQGGFVVGGDNMTNSTHYGQIFMNGSGSSVNRGPANIYFSNPNAMSIYSTDAELDIGTGMVTAGTPAGLINFYVDGSTTPTMTLINGKVGIGAVAPTAVLHLKAGSATANTSPLKFTSGTNLTTAEAGSMEYDGTTLFFTNGGAQRQEIMQSQQSRVSTQFDKTTNTTLGNITGLTATLVAGKTYQFEAILFITGDVVGGQKYGIAGTATATNIIYEVLTISNSTNAIVISSKQTSLGGSVGQAGATDDFTRITGVITVNAAGTLTVQFAQNASSGTSSVLVGSYFSVTQIA
jgi:hypothetical protein